MAADGVHDCVLELIKNMERGKVLDLGAGTGILSFKLQKLGFDVIALDITKENYAAEHITFVNADANYKLPFESECFDYVLSVETIEHLENPWQFLRETHRILKPKGILILTSPNVETIQNRIWFFLRGRFNYFGDNDIEEINHVTPIFTSFLNYMIKDMFIINKITYNKGEIIGILPRIGLLLRPFNIKNKFFGEIRIIKMEKISVSNTK